MRCAYEVMNTAAGKQWDLIVGGTHVQVPRAYLSDLERLSYPPGAAAATGANPTAAVVMGSNIVGAGGEPV